MSNYCSGLASSIITFLDYRTALGYSPKTHEAHMKSIDSFCAANYPDADTLTIDIVTGWLEEQHSGIEGKSIAIRLLGKYLKALGKDSYVLYCGYMKQPAHHAAYIFTDDEMTRLFTAIDKTKVTNSEPFLHEIVPVIYRLIYTCGLRPNEGRELKRENINLQTGEVLIVNTKWKKERLVVMSTEMLAMCQSYDKRREVFGRDNPYFFPSWAGGPFRTCQLGLYFTDAWKRANPGVESRLLPNVRVYDLRHRFCSAALIRWLETGQPLRAKLAYLRAYMGHNSLSETAYYIHLLPENLVKSAGIDWAALDEVIPEVVTWEE